MLYLYMLFVVWLFSNIRFYTTGLMTTSATSGIVIREKIRTSGPERKGNAADPYDLLEFYNQPV